MTMKSAFSASRLRAVSLSVSPFLSEEASALKLIISAERRCSQSSKLIRVRVDGSTNRLMTVLPRKAGTFLIARSPTALKARAVSSTVRISSALSDSISSKCLRVQLTRSSGVMESWSDGVLEDHHPSVFQYSNTPILQYSVSFSFEHDFIHTAGLVEPHMDIFIEGGGKIFSDEIGFDGQLAMAAIDQHCKFDALRPAEVIERVHGCPDRASAEEHVIRQHHRLAVYIEREQCGLNSGRHPPVQIITVHTDVQSARRHRVAPNPGQ